MSTPKKVVLVYCDGKMTDWMQRADMFERFKVVLGGVMSCEWTPKEGQTFEDLVAVFRKNDKPEYRLIAAFAVGDPDCIWKDETVKAISTGKNWCTFDEYLKAYGCAHKEAVLAA